MKRSLLYIYLTCLCLGLLIVIVLFFPRALVLRGYLGDSLVVMLIYCGLKVFHNFRSLRLIASVVALAFFVEFTQFFQLAKRLGLETNPISRLVLGSVFDPLDLVAYLAGALVVLIIDTRVLSNPRQNGE